MGIEASAAASRVDEVQVPSLVDGDAAASPVDPPLGYDYERGAFTSKLMWTWSAAECRKLRPPATYASSGGEAWCREAIFRVVLTHKLVLEHRRTFGPGEPMHLSKVRHSQSGSLWSGQSADPSLAQVFCKALSRAENVRSSSELCKRSALSML